MTQKISTSIEGFSLRFAGKGDLDTILNFIEELAKYEKLSHQVEANKKQLDKYLFGSNSYAEVIIAEKEGTAVGFALFFHNFSTFLGKPGLYLEDLFVKPKYRHKGFGTEILCFLSELAVERDCGRFEWSVLDWNEPAIQFYESIGARPVDGWARYRLKGESLKKLANIDDRERE